MAIGSSAKAAGAAALTADGMLPGPPSKENGGCADCSAKGLLGYGAGSSIVVVELRSMQLVTVLPMPPQSVTPLQPASFVTCVRWSPQAMPRDLSALSDASHLRLAAGDRQGRIAIWDVSARAVCDWLAFDPDRGRLGVQDICWFVHGSRSLVIAIHGSSLLSIWNMQSCRCVWKYDAYPEVLACVRRDPFDSRHACILATRGVLFSVKVIGDSDGDILLQQFQLEVSLSETEGNLKGDREATSQSPSSPAMVLFPNASFRCMFSLCWAHIVYIMFPREFVVFDLQYGAVLSVTSLPRGYSKLLDLIVDIDGVLLCCLHADGKLSMWKRKEGKQVYVLCTMQALMPSLGTSVPSPSVLSVSYYFSDLELEKVREVTSKESDDSNPFGLPPTPENDSSFALSVPGVNTSFISISDDGKVWHWSMTLEMPAHPSETKFGPSDPENMLAEIDNKSHAAALSRDIAAVEAEESKAPKRLHMGALPIDVVVTKTKLISQLHLLPSAVTTLAVPSPSLTATLNGGGNDPAVAVPLVALATQAGSIEIIDVAATAIVTSFSIHSNAVRGLRWLGNSKLVSFSYSEANEKVGGFVNKLAVSCVRTGRSRFFRVMQKPERAPMRALRASPSGRYLIILFREAPAEVWAMTRDPQMLRSLALPFSVVEWALPPVPKPSLKAISRQSSFFSRERPTIASAAAAASAQSLSDTKGTSSGERTGELVESFAFALINGSVGVFELRGRAIKDFRPKRPPSSFISSDTLITAMAYRTPHVVMGDRQGNISWWDVTTGLCSSFNTYRGGIRRIKFAPFVIGDYSRGRVAVLFNDNTFSIYDLDTQNPLANAILQPHFAGILVLELDWFPLRLDKKEPLLLCIAGADGSFCLLEVNPQANKSGQINEGRVVKDKFRPMPLCSTILLPVPHALAFRMLLQWGVHASWFNFKDVSKECISPMLAVRKSSPMEEKDFRNYMLQTSLPQIGDKVVLELLLKILEPYRNAGQLLDKQRARLYSMLLDKSCTARFAFAAAQFGDLSEAAFWVHLQATLCRLIRQLYGKVPQEKSSHNVSLLPGKSDSLKSHESAEHVCSPRRIKTDSFRRSILHNTDSGSHCLWMSCKEMSAVPSDKESVRANALERISWHENINGEDALQRHIHELIAVGDLETAVNLLLSTPPESPNFYADALRAIALSSAVSPALHELAVKVVAANMVGTDKSLSGTHLLCAVGRSQEACSQLQDAGYWRDAATLAATHLEGSDYSRVLQRWAYHVLHNEQNLWRAVIMLVAAGLLHEALGVLRDSREPDTAVMFLLACHEIKARLYDEICGVDSALPEPESRADATLLDLPGDLNQHKEDVLAVCEFYGQYQRDLVHLCTELAPSID